MIGSGFDRLLVMGGEVDEFEFPGRPDLIEASLSATPQAVGHCEVVPASRSRSRAMQLLSKKVPRGVIWLQTKQSFEFQRA